jgi:hypothetical protein
MKVPVEKRGQAKIWVTRKGVRADRIGSAWLIRRFIDPQASFRFVTPNDYGHKRGEIRFDMFEGEFAHTDDRCTFEALVDEIVHDINLKGRTLSTPRNNWSCSPDQWHVFNSTN